MKNKTNCTLLERVDPAYAVRVARCCDHHDDAYGRPRLFRRLSDDFKWGRCAWKKIDGLSWAGIVWHRTKTIAYAVFLMTFGGLLYYNIVDWFYKRFPFLRKVKEWMH